MLLSPAQFIDGPHVQRALCEERVGAVLAMEPATLREVVTRCEQAAVVGLRAARRVAASVDPDHDG